MTTPARIDFASRFTGPETLAVCVLVAGVPIVLVPAGTAPTTTAVSSGTVDPLWWPGTGTINYALPGAATNSPVKAWLDPGVTWEFARRADPLKGDAKVDALVFDLFDVGGEATAVLSAPRARVAELLTADVSSTDTSVPIGSTSTVPTSGIAWLGREAFIYDGVGGGALTLTSAPAARGRFGTRARSVRLNTARPQLVSVGAWPRSWYGRLATVWLCRLSGATLYDPTLVYAGTVGPGVRRLLAKDRARWQLPIDHVTEVLSRQLAPRGVTLQGVAHYDNVDTIRAPLQRSAFLGRATGAPHRGGFHADFAGFLRDWNDFATVVGYPVRAHLDGGRLVVVESGLGADLPVPVAAAWNDPPVQDVRTNGSGVLIWRSRRTPTDTCLHLDGAVPLFVPGDAATIPSTTSVGSDGARAQYVLTAETRAGEEVSAVITGTGTSDGTPYVVLGAIGAWASDHERQQATVVTRPTRAELGVEVQGSHVPTALTVAAALLDSYDGGLHEDVIDWDAISRAFNSVPLGGLPGGRRYVFRGEDTLLRALSHEARLRGMALCTRNGRLSVYRTAVFASTEETTTTITDGDLIHDVEPEVIDAPQPVATSMLFALPGGDAYQWVDDTARAEHGDGETVECLALSWVSADADLSQIAASIQRVAQQVLGALAEPYRVVKVVLGPRFFSLQEGDLVLFSHPRVPTLVGTIGVTEATCQVQDVRQRVFGGAARTEVSLRLQEPDLAGYAPEALVAAGGLSVGGGMTVVTVDTSSGFGATCFARAARPDGSASTNAVDGFTAGDYVVLSQLDSRTPAADEGGTVVSVGTNTLTLSFAASAGMQTAAAAQYGCVVRFADWTVVDAGSPTPRDRQERYLYVADASSRELGSGDPAKRWAA